MNRDLIHKRTRDALREYFVGWHVLRSIRDAFEGEYIACDENYVPPHPGERRCLVEQFYITLDFSSWEDVKRILGVFETIFMSAPESASKEIEILKNLLLKDGFKYENGQLTTVNQTLPSVGMATSVATDFNTPRMMEQIRRIEASIEDDPDLAIGTAKELLESCCKTILSDRAVPYDSKLDMPDLIKAVQAELKLMPDDIPDSAKGAKSIKRMLNNLGDVVRGMAEIRNLYGSGHGKHGRDTRVKPRHAKLAVGAATTLVVFLYETHMETLDDA